MSDSRSAPLLQPGPSRCLAGDVPATPRPEQQQRRRISLGPWPAGGGRVPCLPAAPAEQPGRAEGHPPADGAAVRHQPGGAREPRGQGGAWAAAVRAARQHQVRGSGLRGRRLALLSIRAPACPQGLLPGARGPGCSRRRHWQPGAAAAGPLRTQPRPVGRQSTRISRFATEPVVRERSPPVGRSGTMGCGSCCRRWCRGWESASRCRCWTSRRCSASPAPRRRRLSLGTMASLSPTAPPSP